MMADDKTSLPETRVQQGNIASSKGEVSSFLQQVRAMAPAKSAGRGRLIFAMDATMSRQPTWDSALATQAEMFEEAGRIGGLDVQLVYFRGFRECRASRWVNDANGLSHLMTSVECRGGNTQIGRVLSHVLKEARKSKVNAVVYVGDCMEENIDALCQKAGEIGLLGIRMFMFQEGHDMQAQAAFREIARLTNGAYSRFDHTSVKQLRELLGAVAAYAAGGKKALSDMSERNSGAPRALLEQMK